VGGRTPASGLTPTERQIAELIASGRTYREVAAELFISPENRAVEPVEGLPQATRLLSVDSWQADGTTTTASGSRPVSLRLRNNGVFRQRGAKCRSGSPSRAPSTCPN